jgi:hypothetical protein
LCLVSTRLILPESARELLQRSHTFPPAPTLFPSPLQSLTRPTPSRPCPLPPPCSRRRSTATQKQIEANRRNAQLGTGPKTPEGKAVASCNAKKHGLASRLVVLPEENRQDFLDLLAAFRAEFQPATAFEESLACQLAAADWRLRPPAPMPS